MIFATGLKAIPIALTSGLIAISLILLDFFTSFSFRIFSIIHKHQLSLIYKYVVRKGFTLVKLFCCICYTFNVLVKKLLICR